jgi:hypothetical protein
LDPPHDFTSARHAMLGLVREDSLAVQHHVQHARPGEAHLGREVQLVLDFALEAPGLEEKVESSKTALDLNGHDVSP